MTEKNKYLWAPKAAYYTNSAASGSFLNFFPIFCQNVLLYSKTQIATLQTIQCICAMISPPAWGAVADYIDNLRVVHVGTLVGGACILSLLQFSSSFAMAIAVILCGNALYTCNGSFLDTTTLSYLKKTGGEYGKQRLFGALGYGTFSYITGGMVALWGIEWSFYNLVVLAVCAVFFITRMPAPKKSDHVDEKKQLEEGSQDAKPSLGEALKEVLHEPDVLVLLLTVLLMAVMYGVLSSFLTLNLFNLSGENPQIVGIAILCETTSELPAFFYSQKIIDKLGTVGVLLLSCAAYCTRITCYALMPNAWVAIPFEFLHGMTFGLSWAAIIQYMYKRAPVGAEATLLGMTNGVQNGLGRALGTLLGGYLYENYGPRVMWGVTDLFVPLALCTITVFAYLKKDGSTKENATLDEEAELLSPVNASASEGAYGTDE